MKHTASDEGSYFNSQIMGQTVYICPFIQFYSFNLFISDLPEWKRPTADS